MGLFHADRRARPAALWLALLIGPLACSTVTTGTQGPFHDVARAQAELVRGQSTRSDVERVLGRPLASGTALFPTQAGLPRDLWVYQDMEVRMDVGRSSGEGTPVLTREQFILVFFDGELFEGLMWWPAEMTGTFGSAGGP
jgi:hypothetical protein